MSLVAHDADADGDQDVVVSDRRGSQSGVFWLENPGATQATHGANWLRHTIGASGEEAMFLNLGDVNRDGLCDVVASTWNGHLEYFQRLPGRSVAWQPFRIELPFGLQRGKSVAVADIDLDGAQELVTTNYRIPAERPAIAVMEYDSSPIEARWKCEDIGGPEGSKFDRIELIDVDADGDLDLVACEEVANFGVISTRIQRVSR
jgi:hypothetical protein